jgi:hypothetical protein
MANSDQPKGFRPYGRIKQVVAMEAGSACYPGDFVSLASDGQVDPTGAGATIFGLCLNYAAAAGDVVQVSCDPDQIYIGQCDETEINAQTFVGNNCDIVATAGNSTYKTSRQEVDSSDNKTSAAQLTILGLYGEVGNSFGGYADVLVKVNEHQAWGADAFAGI